MDRGHALKIQLMGRKNGSEKLLYEFETFLSSFSINWPSADQFYTNNFTLGSEFVRLSDLPDSGYVKEYSRGLLAFRGPLAQVVIDIPGRDELFINVLVDAPEKLSSQADLILDLLVDIKTSIEGGPI